jgi:dihydroorotase
MKKHCSISSVCLVITLMLACFYFSPWAFAQTTYDVVIENGRVMDPETGFDAVRNVGIIADRVVEISELSLKGRKTIDANGLVVAPGFIDLHVHGMSNDAHRYQARDGVTTALELEAGKPFIGAWLKSKEGQTIVNYGASTPHAILRGESMSKYAPVIERTRLVGETEGYESPKLKMFFMNLKALNAQALDEEGLSNMGGLIKRDLEAGAIGIGVPVGYYTGASRAEILQVYQYAADYGVPVFSHTRGNRLPGVHEAIANATVTGASLHIVHANSISLDEIETTLSMVEAAQSNGLDITTEIYPYTAGSTYLQSNRFDPGWQEERNITYSDLQWQDTGERLTKETFERYRKQGGIVIIHMMKPEWIATAMKSPLTSIGSDGMAYAPGAHPRTAGTFSRVLGKYVREDGVISLMEGLRKMTLMPAQRIEKIAPVMKRKGRLQVGSDADITIFNPNTIIDKATFDGIAYSKGVMYVLVNGVLVVNEGENVKGAMPGRAVKGGMGGM